MKVIKLAEVDSTNNYAKSHIENLEDKTLVCADSQSSGRGRLNRSWVDLGVGNLFLSFVLKPSKSFQPFFPNLTQYLSVVLCKVLEFYGLNPQIKWPNDVLINGKKVAGILSESVISGGKFDGIVLGIGVNLKSTVDDVNSIEGRIVTALNIEGVEVSRDEFLDKLSVEFFKDYDKFLNSGFSFISDDYIKRNCFLNKELEVLVLNDKKCGFAKEVNKNGELVLISNDNCETVLTIGDIL